MGGALLGCESSDPKGSEVPEADMGANTGGTPAEPDGGGGSPSPCGGAPEGTFCLDADGDGHGDPATSASGCPGEEGRVEICDDCDDSAPGAFPGAPEQCNGADDDCDGTPDNGLDVGLACHAGVGACEQAGTTVCNADGTVGCDAAPAAPSAEICDGADNDCNGAVDDTGASETCDGADNDCDGQIDEDLGVGEACTVGQGACRAEGVNACTADGQVACNAIAGAPSEETCDGVDNDCDGIVDNAATECACVDGTQVACGSDVGICTLGTQTCVGGQLGPCEGATAPGEETCDGGDQDCNGVVDDRAAGPCDCLDGEIRACGSDVGACQAGTQTCVDGAFGPCDAVGPTDESCNGLDDDCNGVDDDRAGDACECVDGSVMPCGSDVGTCQAGTQTCVSGHFGACEGAIGPTPEIFDGEDNDCNGAPDDVVCGPAATDFPLDARYAACISIDGAFHAFDPANISSNARTEAFDQIAALLWRAGGVPTPQNFADARVIYALAEGIDSRVQRRFDSHFTDTAPAGTNCRTAGVPAMYPAYCVGPARILPIVTAAFDGGMAGTEPQVNAARIEAALLWFFWTSVYKESNTCATAIADCDSSHAYYTAATPRAEPSGLARYVAAVAPAAHDRVFDGTLATHCWREIDNGATAADLPFQAQALAQLDVALDHAAARILIGRLYAFAAHAGDERLADWSFVQIWGEAFDRALRVRDPQVADQVAAALQGDGAAVDPAALEIAILSTIPCP